ncbi:MAG: anhydro-N-acetylmuramic acid kinase [Terriglobia bacterium]
MRSSRWRWTVGLISGTSMDGVDAALVGVQGPIDRPRLRVCAFRTFPFPPFLRKQLFGLASGERTTAREISTLNFLLGEALAEAALAICREGRIAPQKLTVIGSHGQTIFHQGSRHGANPASTFQIGESAVIAERTGVPVVADFRVADVAAGGEGAPLVPLVDYLLLRDRKQGTVALNIGGIANVTVLPAGSRPSDVFGFDTGPGNMLVDGLVRRFTGGRKHFDANGHWAAEGKALQPLLREMLRAPFFRKRPPKSAGREQFGEEYLEAHFLKHRNASAADLLRTATELTARSVVSALKRFVFPRVRIHRLIVSGGGAHNTLLLTRTKELLPQVAVHLSDHYGLPVDAKEAIAFAVLADRSLHGLPGNLPAVTGARHAVVLGKVAQPGMH